MTHSTSWPAILALVSTLSSIAALADSPTDRTATSGPLPAGGIWKAAVPPKAMHAEFDGLDPLGLAAGAQIKADCSLNWVDPDDGARYCFSSGTSLEFFLDHPKTSIQRARREWQKLRGRTVSHTE